MAERSHATARCPLRPMEPCTVCQIGATGPQDCPIVWLVMDDDELREQLRPHTQAAAAARRAEKLADHAA